MIIKSTPKYGSNFLSYSNGVEYFADERMYVLSKLTTTSSSLSMYNINGVLKSSIQDPAPNGDVSSICTDDDANAYLRTAISGFEQRPAIYKYDKNGNFVDSKIDSPGGTNNPGIIYDGGFIYTKGDSPGTLAKYDLDLNLIWSVNIASGPSSITSDSTSIYAVSNVPFPLGTGPVVYKISKSGSISWSVQIISVIRVVYTLSISSTGMLYVGGLTRETSPFNNWCIISSTGSIVNSGYLSFTFSSPVPAPHPTLNTIYTMTADSSDNLYIASAQITGGATLSQPLIKCNSSMSIIGTESNPTTLTSKWPNSTTKSIFIYNNNIYALSNLSLSSVEPGVRVYDSNLNYVNQFSLPSEQAAIVF